MKTFELKVGEHYRLRRCRYLVTDIRGDSVQLRALDGAKVVLRHSATRLCRALKQGQMIKVQEAPLTTDPQLILAGLPKHVAVQFQRRWHYVQALMKRFRGKLPETSAQQLITQLGEEINDISPPSLSSARCWVRAFRRAGENCLALVPRQRCKRRHPLLYQPTEVQQIFNQQVGRLYLQPEPASKVEVIDAIVEELEAFNSGRPDHDKLKVPSTSTLHRLLRDIDAHQRAMKQFGANHAARENRWSIRTPRPSRLFEQVEGDTQMMHLMGADKDGRVIGRPTLTALLETSSGRLVSRVISYSPACAETTLRAFRWSISSDNPLGGVAQRYVFDNGIEFREENVRRSIELFGAEVCFNEPGKPCQKARVEAFFGSWSKEIAHFMPGTTFSNTDARGDYNPAKQACLTLEEITAYFDRWVEEVYHERWVDDLRNSPRQHWEEMLRTQLPPRRHSPEELKRHFWSAFYATPQQGRVRFNSLFWTGPAVSYLAHREPKTDKLLVYYDAADLGHAWACHPAFRDEPMELQAVDPAYQEGLTLDLHQRIQKRLRECKQAFNHKWARKARVEILDELAKVKTRGQRLEHHRALSKGSLKPKPARTPRSKSNPGSPSAAYQYHSDTPGAFASEKLSPKPSVPRKNKKGE